MKAKDMREKSAADLKELEKSLAEDHFHAKLKNFTNRLDDTSSIKKLRRDVARVKTLLAQQARGAAPVVKAPKAKPVATPKAAAKKAAAPAAPKSKPAAKHAPTKAEGSSKTTKSEAKKS